MAGATAFCSFGAPMACIGDELEDQVLRLEAGSSLMFEECWGFALEETGDHVAAAATAMEADFLPLHGLGLGTAPGGATGTCKQQQVQPKHEPSTESNPSAAPIPAGLELGELAKETQRALITAAKKNQLAVTMYKTPVQAGAWQGCILSPWCNSAASHLGPCNCKATIPGVAAYSHTAEFTHDEPGAAHDSEDGTPHGQQADSSAANSGKHGSSATHHTEDGENTSSTGCQGPAVNCGLLKTSSPPAGSLARSFSAGHLQQGGPQPIKQEPHRAPSSKHCSSSIHLDLGMETDLPPLWVRSGPALMSSTCGEKAQLLGAPEDQPLTLLPVSHDLDHPLLSGGAALRQVTDTSAGSLPSSFVMFNELGGWCSASTAPADQQQQQQHDHHGVGLEGHHHQDGKPVQQQQGGAEDSSNSSKRSLRPTRSMPNFRSMALGVAPNRAGSTPSACDARRSMGSHHRWTGSTNGSQARKARASDELSRAAFSTGHGIGDLSVAAPVPGQASHVGVDLASPLSATPSTTSALPQQVFQALNSVPEEGKPCDPAAGPAKHGHNLRGRAAGVQDAALLPGPAPVAPPPPSAPAAQQLLTPGANGMACTNEITGLRISRLPEVPPPQTLGGRKRGAPGGVGSTCARPVPHPTGQCCTACGTTVTPVWRAGPQGPKTLCNACGVRYMKVAKKK